MICAPHERLIVVYLISTLLVVCIGVALAVDVTDQKTPLDKGMMLNWFHAFRRFMFNFVGKTGLRTKGSFLQEKIPDDLPFPCNVSLGRSEKTPKSVHKLRPGKFEFVLLFINRLSSFLLTTNLKE